jgi:hypothetical protein
MPRFEADLAIGISKTIMVVAEFPTLAEAQVAFEDPQDDLREQIEDAMRAVKVDPELRGWQNYQVLAVEEVTTDRYSDDELELALWGVLKFNYLEDMGNPHELYGTAEWEVTKARLRVRAEKTAKKGRAAILKALKKEGCETQEQIRRAVNDS